MSSAQKTAYTPGPLTAEPMEDGCSVAFRIMDTNGDEVAVTSGRSNDGEEEANAHLFAAAPELLAALKDALRSSRKEFKLGPDGDRQHREAYAEQFAAIAKAESR